MSLENLTEEEQSFVTSMESAGIPTTEAGLKTKYEEMAEADGIEFKNDNENAAWWRWLKSIAVLPVLWLIEFQAKEIMPNLFVKTAKGKFLDLLAWAYGLTRKAEAKAQGLIKFSRDSIGVSLTIPAGTWIKTTSINGNVYRVKTIKEFSFGNNDFDLLVEVEAEFAGAEFNLADNYFILLEEPIVGITAVTNESDWLTIPGAAIEDDEDFRLRIRGHFSTVSDHHVNSVYKSIIANQTGFNYERIFIDHTLAPRGPGSADAYVLFDVGQPAQSYLDTVNSYIRDEGNHGHGDDIEVKAMPSSDHGIAANLWVSASTTEEEKAKLKNDVEQMIRCAFRENSDFEVTLVFPHSRFSIGRLTSEILRKFDVLESIEFGQADIVSSLDVPTIKSLDLMMGEVA